MPYNAYIVSTARTPVGRSRGSLSHWHPADIGAAAVDAAVARSGLPPSSVDDVVFGCVSQYGAQSGNVARTVVLSSTILPQSVPGTTVDRQCGSSQQALHFAAQAVMSGTQDVVVAGGVEVMSLVPIGSAILDGVKHTPSRGNPFGGRGFAANYAARLEETQQKGGVPSQFVGAELLVRKYNMSREELDALAVRSHSNAAAATDAGKFADEIVPVRGVAKDGGEFLMRHDEGIRRGTSAAALGQLKALVPGGKLTAATASQVSDGAAALVVVNDRALRKYGLTPLARVKQMALSGCDPVVMLEGPVFASRAALAAAGLTIDDMDLYEVNEAFASVPLAFAKALNADMAKLNVNGSAIALGHPLGATGARIITSLVAEMWRRRSRYALVAICEGGGTANATILERCDGPLPLPPISSRM